MTAKPSDQQRPDLTSDDVIVRAVLQIEDDLMVWVRKHVSKTASKEEAVALATVAIKEAGGDGFRAALRLMEVAGWPVDFVLCRTMQRACDQLAFARRLVVMEWILANRIRFPAEEGDAIEWKSYGKTRTGIVYNVIEREASAIVRPTIGAAISDDMVKIVAEQVTRVKVTKAG